MFIKHKNVRIAAEKIVSYQPSGAIDIYITTVDNSSFNFIFNNEKARDVFLNWLDKILAVKPNIHQLEVLRLEEVGIPDTTEVIKEIDEENVKRKKAIESLINYGKPDVPKPAGPIGVEEK